MAESDNIKVVKQTGPKSVEELQRKGPPTREEVEAIAAKTSLGITMTEEESDRLLEFYSTRPNASDLPTILAVLYPNCEWTIAGRGQGQGPDQPGATDYSDLIWDEDNPLPKPTMAELEKMRPYVQDILDQQQYINLRRNAYPNETLLCRALWEYIVEGDDEFLNALQARRIAVKKRFPKPENKHWMVQSEDYLKILPNTPADILRNIDEKEAKALAFKPGVQSTDAESLIASGTLEEKAEAIIAKREAQARANDKNVSITQTDATPQPTIADVEEFKGAPLNEDGAGDVTNQE